MDVYKHDDIPSKLNYKNNVRIGDIVIFTHVGYTVYINNKTIDWEVTSNIFRNLLKFLSYKKFSNVE